MAEAEASLLMPGLRWADPRRSSIASGARGVASGRSSGGLKWRLLVEAGRKAGDTFSQPDLIIAATALRHGLTVVTRDRADYERAGAPVLDPWTDAPP